MLRGSLTSHNQNRLDRIDTIAAVNQSRRDRQAVSTLRSGPRRQGIWHVQLHLHAQKKLGEGLESFLIWKRSIDVTSP